MGSLWSFLAKPKNQKTLSWLGGGAAIAVGGIWVVVTYLWPHDRPAPEAAPKIVCAQPGAVAAGHDASGNTITVNGNVLTGDRAPCVDVGKSH
jgi:hypothetical protein